MYFRNIDVKLEEIQQESGPGFCIIVCTLELMK